MKHAYVPRTTTYNLNPGEELNDLRMSDEVRPLYEHVKKFIRETVDPMSVEFMRLASESLNHTYTGHAFLHDCRQDPHLLLYALKHRPDRSAETNGRYDKYGHRHERNQRQARRFPQHDDDHANH